MTIHHALAAFAITVAGLVAIAVLAQQEWTRQRREAAQRASAARRAGAAAREGAAGGRRGVSAHECDNNGVLCRACDLALLDADIRGAGFFGYEDCPAADCPTPYHCSERGSCRQEAAA